VSVLPFARPPYRIVVSPEEAQAQAARMVQADEIEWFYGMTCPLCGWLMSRREQREYRRCTRCWTQATP
jgi:hypothetical protein